MSEFEQTPESMRAEQLMLESKLTELNEAFAEIPLGEAKVMATQTESDRIRAEAGKVKLQLFELLVALQDIQEIANRLEAEIYSQKEALSEEPLSDELPEDDEEEVELFPLFIEEVLDDTFAVEIDSLNKYPDVKKVVGNITQENGLLTFEESE